MRALNNTVSRSKVETRDKKFVFNLNDDIYSKRKVIKNYIYSSEYKMIGQ